MDVDSEEANHLLISLLLGGLKASQSSGQVMSSPQPSCGCGDGGWREYILCVRLFLGGVVVPITTSTSISLPDIVSRNSSAVLRRVEVLSHVHNIL